MLKYIYFLLLFLIPVGGQLRAQEMALAEEPLPGVTVVAGEILEVSPIEHPGMTTYGVHLLLGLDDGTELTVHVGPSWFLEEQAVSFTVGDAIEIEGFMTDDGILIAALLKWGEQELQLRDSNGVPVWSGRGRAP